jgi:REP element-mobilizing transposase RayT
MARRPRVFAPGLLYHIIARGNQRQKTFLNHRDYQAYLERLAKYRKKFAVTLYAYCLMPNHVHFLVEPSSVPLARFMQGLQQSYTQYFNRIHHKVGHLFQGRYWAIVCEKNEYLLALVRYIHLNPVRAKMVPRPEGYRYSGHGVYLAGKATELIDPSRLLEMLGGRKGYERFVIGGIGEGHKHEYYQVEDQRFLGSEGFREKITVEAEREKTPSRQPLAAVMRRLAREFGVESRELRGPDRGWQISRIRAMVGYVLVRRLGYQLREVASYFSRDVATVSSVISRLAERMEKEERLKKEVGKLAKIV